MPGKIPENLFFILLTIRMPFIIISSIIDNKGLIYLVRSYQLPRAHVNPSKENNGG
jgi:hypothetical protein